MKWKKASVAAVSRFDDWLREERALEARVHKLCDKLNLLKRRESTNCDLEVTTRKVADTQGDTTNMVTGLHRSTVSL